MDRFVHQVLQSPRLLQVLRILRIDDLKKNLLDVRLIRLVLDDLAEFYSVHFGGDESLKLVEKTLLLRQNGLQGGRYLRGDKDVIGGL